MAQADNTPAGRDAPGTNRRQSRLSIAALLLAVLAVPAALFPWLGLVVAVVVLAVALVALIRTMRSSEISRGYPIAAVGVSIAAVALAGIITNGTANQIEECDPQDQAELEQCLEDGRSSN